MLIIFSSPPFYTTYVRLPTAEDPVPPRIADDPRFFPFLKDTVGAIDGTHISVTPSAEERQTARDRKGGISQNCLACCSFDLRFQYILSGWDGSAADAAIFNDARTSSLPMLPGKYYLADAGFGTCDALLVPYRGVRYHLAEWRRADLRSVYQ